MVKHGLARAGAAAGDDVDDAGGGHLVEELAELEERKRRRRGGLDHERVARGEGRRDLPGAHQEREVPRNDLADDADGLVQHDAHRVFVDHDGGALFGAQATGEVAEVVGGERNVDERGFADRLAVVERFDHGETSGVFIDEIGDLQKKGGALLRGLGGPGGEGGAGGGDGTVDVGGGTHSPLMSRSYLASMYCILGASMGKFVQGVGGTARMPSINRQRLKRNSSQ